MKRTTLFQVVKIFLQIHILEQWIQRSLLKIFFSNLHQISTLYQDMLDCDSCITWLVSKLVLWAQSTTEDYIRAENKLQFISQLFNKQIVKHFTYFFF